MWMRSSLVVDEIYSLLVEDIYPGVDEIYPGVDEIYPNGLSVWLPCRSRNSPGFDPSILRHSGIWGAADEAVLKQYKEKNKSKKIPLLKIYNHNLLSS